MFDYVYTDHAQYTIKTYAKMALFPLVLTGPLSVEPVQIGRIRPICTPPYRPPNMAGVYAATSQHHAIRE